MPIGVFVRVEVLSQRPLRSGIIRSQRGWQFANGQRLLDLLVADFIGFSQSADIACFKRGNRCAIDQQNAVPAGSLDGTWGDIAFAVAGAAAPGVAALIERAKSAGTGS